MAGDGLDKERRLGLRFVCDVCKARSVEAAGTLDPWSAASEQGWRLLYLDDWSTEHHICSVCADGRSEAEMLDLLHGAVPRAGQF